MQVHFGPSAGNFLRRPIDTRLFINLMNLLREDVVDLDAIPDDVAAGEPWSPIQIYWPSIDISTSRTSCMNMYPFLREMIPGVNRFVDTCKRPFATWLLTNIKT